MRFIIALLAVLTLANGGTAAAEECAVPPSLIASDNALTRVAQQIKEQRRLDISVIGTGSSTLPGPDGAQFAYPARLEAALKQQLPGTAVKLTAHVASRQTTAQMVAALQKILAEDKPALVVWQAGTFDALSGVEPDTFSANLAAGVAAINAAGADVDLLDMQYSPHTAAVLDVTAYADVMRWVAQEHGALLFDRLAIMRYWSEEGVFDLYAATKKYDMARKVHDCIGRALAFQIVNAAHLTP
jgi:GDSL-like Lipase/Acylhydrolase family